MLTRLTPLRRDQLGINIFSVSPITGTVIAANVITAEAVNVAINTPPEVDLHLNNFSAHSMDVNNLGSGTVNATENWWGCAAGPGKDNCATISGSGVTFIPFLTQPFR
ncbi:MAG TPA: hypothetical protein VL349_02250 [Terriglobales bacterium]|jgi:hypothetical protein|nr:hypothetical protein [Terriglobales bacterium]